MIDLSFPIEHFKKRAKDLLGHVRATNGDTCNRVRLVYNDAATETDDELAADFGLMRAQHVVAIEHGFESWDALTKTTAIQARLAITMDREPLLNDFGIGIFGGQRQKPKSEQQAIFAENRAALRKSASSVESVVRWLRENVQPTKTINKDHTSYGLKHVAEGDIGYVTNGVFIAAGIIAGYPYEIPYDSPNVPFGMSEKSLREISTRRVAPERVLKRFIPMAVEILAGRGIHAHAARGRAGTDLVWSEDGDVRTLKVGATETKPFLVRIYVDHYELFVSTKVAKSIGASPLHRYVAMAKPVRPNAEITILLDEVPAALAWALAHDARSGTVPPPPPFKRSPAERPSAGDTWSYVWSERAWEAYRAKSPAKKAG